jgi:hypothetical protein
MCPALALRLAADPKKRGANGGLAATPMPIPAPTLRTGLLGGRSGGPKSITAG